MIETYGGLSEGDIFFNLGVPNKRLFLYNLEERMKEGYLFVILDPIIDCVPLLNANEYAQVNAVLKPLRTLALKYGAHILCVHHSNRQGAGANSFLGSQAFRGFSDTNFWLEGTGKSHGFSPPKTVLPRATGGSSLTR